MLIRPLGHPGDLGWVIQAHGELYAAEHAWDTSFEALVAKIVSDYAEDHDPTREGAWIAELDGQRVGCVFCVREDDKTAKLRVLLVHPDARGHGAGNRRSLVRAEDLRGARVRTGRGDAPAQLRP
ncbi:GNAT family N-acetyltransferase [Lentzea sp. HUAS TT2]|uniref:GNAT family N-acetyltransferase n=1 Tax=Lentzea sp. HUAS TT2 TaxID=3447454 RepID=UPI003F7262FB